MMNHDTSVAGRAHVELDAVGAERHRMRERGQRIFGGQSGAAAMGEYERTRRGEEGVNHARGSV